MQFKPHSEYRHRVNNLRKEMEGSPVSGLQLHAYILTTYDEHQNEYVAPRDKRIEYLTGFSGSSADVVVRRSILLNNVE